MSFRKKSNKGRKIKTVIFIFFQTPSVNLFTILEEFLTGNNLKCRGYFAKHSLSIYLNYIGDINYFSKYIREHSSDQIIIIGSPRHKELNQELLLSLKFSQAVIKLVPVEPDLLSGFIRLDQLNDLPHIRLFPKPVNRIEKFVIYLIDKVVALTGLSISAFLFPFIAAAIKLTSKGSVIYKQTRLGKNAREFVLYKFRTMYQEAEKNGPRLSHPQDKRITNIGKILRYWHIDELPQFWNILKGDMALVGPRPERPFYARYLCDKIPYYKIIYQSKPGLTSLGMVKYGYASSIEEMTDRLYYDIVYLNHPSLLMNLKIIGQTIQYLFSKTFKRYGIRRENTYNTEEKILPSCEEPVSRWFKLRNLNKREVISGRHSQ
jgi:lipopolysaccharide/colanic/teichoic acid biosynthesis glycosyltransferase